MVVKPRLETKTFPLSPRDTQKSREIDDFYHKLLYWYYDRQNLAKARPIARRLERLLSEVSSDQQTILGEGAWSLVLECKGDLFGAIQRRENEIPCNESIQVSGILLCVLRELRGEPQKEPAGG